MPTMYKLTKASFPNHQTAVPVGRTYTADIGLMRAEGGDAVVTDVIWEDGTSAGRDITIADGETYPTYISQFTVVSGNVYALDLLEFNPQLQATIIPELEGKIYQLFTFKETSETAIIDESGNGNDGIWGTNGVVPPLISDSFGNTERAYDYSMTGYKPINTQTENLAITTGAMMWVGKMTEFASQINIIDRYNNQNGNIHLYNINGAWSVKIQSASYGTDIIDSDATTVIGQNDIIICRWSGTYFELWVNGVKQTTTHTGQTLDTNANPIVLNGYSINNSSSSRCINQEYCLFDKELTEDDIALIQSQGSVRNDRG